jgi:prepilin peptidase CpaA
MNTVSWMVLGGLVAGAVATDVTQRRIPNPLILLGLFLGVALATTAAGLQGSLESLAGAAAGLALLLPLFAMRWLGAGDVKLMAVIGSFVGLPGVLWVVVYTGLAGGALALAARWSAGRISFIGSASRLPYAVAIAAGTAIWLLTRT